MLDTQGKIKYINIRVTNKKDKKLSESLKLK